MYYRSRLDTGDFEYARVDADSGRAHYFDDELRIWIADDALLLEIAEDDAWSPCSAAEVLDAAAAPMG